MLAMSPDRAVSRIVLVHDARPTVASGPAPRFRRLRLARVAPLREQHAHLRAMHD
jgi:hypothetical protein